MVMAVSSTTLDIHANIGAKRHEGLFGVKYIVEQKNAIKMALGVRLIFANVWLLITNAIPQLPISERTIPGEL
jgi:hypothetical protein